MPGSMSSPRKILSTWISRCFLAEWALTYTDKVLTHRSFLVLPVRSSSPLNLSIPLKLALPLSLIYLFVNHPWIPQDMSEATPNKTLIRLIQSAKTASKIHSLLTDHGLHVAMDMGGFNDDLDRACIVEFCVRHHVSTAEGFARYFHTPWLSYFTQRTNRCSNCRWLGHNKNHCPNWIDTRVTLSLSEYIMLKIIMNNQAKAIHTV